MTKDINVTHIDSSGIREEIGERKKVELVHERLYKEFNIDQKHNTNDPVVLKQIPHEWLPEILNKAIDIAKEGIGVIEIQNNIPKKLYSLSFQTMADTKKFSDRVNSSMFQSINTIIEGKGLNPQHYHRSIVFTVKTQEGNNVLIEY